MEQTNLNAPEKFSSPQEELEYLRKRVFEKEQKLDTATNNENTDQVIGREIYDYKQNTPEEVMEKGAVIPEISRNEIVLELKPEDHDSTMVELISLVEEKGISNVLDIVAKMDDSHISDDFHRFIVQYLRSGYPLKGYKDKTPLARNLNRTLFEVAILEKRKTEETANLQELAARMEQFLTGMLSITKEEYVTIEIAKSVASKEFVFYVSTPDDMKDLLEKQIMAVFPDSRIITQKDDFNIFVKDGSVSAAYGSLKKEPARSIKTIDEFNIDPLDVILNVFSKIDENDEGAAIQLVYKPVGSFYNSVYGKGLRRVEKGEKGIEEFGVINTFGSKLNKGVNTLFKSLSSAGNSKDKDSSGSIDSGLSESVKKKLEKTIVSTNIRLITSAKEQHRADSMMHELQSAFNQFEKTSGNKITFNNITKRGQRDFITNFIYRRFNPGRDVPLSIQEVLTIVHFPSKTENTNPQLRKLKSTTAPAPIELTNEGILLGINSHANIDTNIHMGEEDRLRHFYAIGQTGTGKTNLLKNMIIQDMQNGEGVCMIDPHGNDIQDVLANVPEDRIDDLIYFDPGYVERPMALNMLEYDERFPEQKSFVVDELFGIFQKLYGEGNPEALGPMFEQYFRNATMLVIEDPASGNTLLDVSRVMSDEEFRKMKLSKCKNPVVVQFWTKIAEKAGGEASLQNVVPYIVSKFDVFLSNEIMRPIIAQPKSSFNFREIMDDKKILLVNLSKGRLGDINSSLLGLIIVGKILMAALSRTDTLHEKPPIFYLYIDEFHNVTTSSIATILSEARKYRLSLTMFHQFIAQLQDNIKNAVFGNVGNMAVFRVSVDDAQYLEQQLAPTFTVSDIMNIDNFNAYMKILSKGVPQKPFNMKTVPPDPEVNKSMIENLKEFSYLRYGRDRAEVEAEILEQYREKEVEIKEESPEKQYPFGV